MSPDMITPAAVPAPEAPGNAVGSADPAGTAGASGDAAGAAGVLVSKPVEGAPPDQANRAATQLAAQLIERRPRQPGAERQRVLLRVELCAHSGRRATIGSR